MESVDLEARVGRIRGPEIFPPTEPAVETELLRETPLDIEKPPLRDFLERSGVSGYVNPATYAGDLTTKAGFSGVAGVSLERQFSRLKNLREGIESVFPAQEELRGLRFTDRRFFFADLTKEATILHDGSLKVDRRLVERNIRAYMELAKRYGISAIPVLFDYRL